MRVLIVSADFPPIVGGIATFTIGLARSLCDAGASVRILTTVRGDEDPRFSRAVVERVSTPFSSRGIKILPLAVATARVAREWTPDIILAMTWAHEGIAVNAASRLVRLPYAVVACGSELRRVPGGAVGRFAMRRVLGRAHLVIAISEYTANLVEEAGVKRERIALVNPPVDTSEWADTRGLPDVDTRFGLQGKRVILTASRLARRKGHAQVLHALARLATRYPGLVYVITGRGGTEAKLRTLASELGIADHVRFIGFVTNEDLRALYHRCEVYVSPSLDDEGDIEGFGLAFVEAGACTRPVIAGDSGGVRDAVVDGTTGFIVNSADANALAEKLDRLLTDKALRDRMGHAGYQRAATEFSYATQGRRAIKAVRSRFPGEGPI